MNALEITALLIDQYLPPGKSNSSSMVCELDYLYGKRKADLVIINPDSLVAFEVKSEKDSLTKLSGQAKDYLACFEEVYIVVAKQHLAESLRIVDQAVGVIVEDAGSLVEYRQPQKNAEIDSCESISMLTKSALTKLVGIKQTDAANYSFTDLATLACSMFTRQQIRENVVQFLHSKHEARFKLFMTEKGKRTHVDDLLFLSRVRPQMVSNH